MGGDSGPLAGGVASDNTPTQARPATQCALVGEMALWLTAAGRCACAAFGRESGLAANLGRGAGGTRRVIGEKRCPAPAPSNRCHSEALSATTSSFILQVLSFPLFGNIES